MSWRLINNQICLLIVFLFVQGSVFSQTITRGPYLQKATSTTMVVRWYTNVSVDSRVTYGTDPDNLSQSVTVSDITANHSIQLTGLLPYTKYYYSVGTSSGIIQSGLQNYFLTSPLPNSEDKYTFWVTGDAGDGSARQKAVRDRFNNYMGENVTNGWLLLGDNAYNDGTESEYTTKFFEIYQGNIMRKTPLWPATGNHDYAGSEARQKDQNIPYFGFFDLPTNAEGGGVPSGSEAYYSFDYGNIHFIALDSYIIENNVYRLFDLAGPQVQWLKQDLAANTKKWTIVYFHHPPYSMGSHNSDTEFQMVKIRENIVPILEQYDVDLVLTGHSHSYERSKLMKGHFGLESTFDPDVHHLSQSSGKYNGTTNSCTYLKDSPSSIGGTVYVVSGSAGQTDYGQAGRFPHDAMYFGNDLKGGSLILEIEANRLDGKWLYEDGQMLDQFTIMKNVNKVTTININPGESVTLDASWVGDYDWSSGQSSSSITVTPSTSGIYTVTDPYECIADTYNINISGPPTTINVSSIGFTEICAGSNVIISYTTSGVFSLGNTFTLQLSNAAGSFASAVNIGTLSSTASGTINAVIPGNIPGGSNYRVRVVSSNPVATGSESGSFTVSSPTAPSVGTVAQPSCSTATGSVTLNGLPSSGSWILTRTPGGTTTTGTGTGTTISGLSTGTYTYTVTNSLACISPASANVVINTQPATPTAPTVATVTQPTCTVATGSVALNNLPSSGSWTLTRTPGGITTTGTGASTTISGLSTGIYTYTVTNSAGCISSASSDVVINAQPATPTAPTVATITQPTCTVATGSVVLNNLPSSGSWTLTRTPGGITTTGTGSSATISGLLAGIYTYTVTSASTCISVSSGDVVINAQPVTPTAPAIGTITQPTCSVGTGSVVLNGLPSSGTWTLTRTPGGITTTGTGISTTLSGLLTGTYTYTVSNSAGCISSASVGAVINVQPVTPTAPSIGMLTQPTCGVSTGSLVLNNLPSAGSWTLTRIPGGVTTVGTGTSVTIAGLATGTYTYTVTNASACVSEASANVVINSQPVTPTAPAVGTVTQPTCTTSTGSVILNGLPSGGWTINPGDIVGTGPTTTLAGLTAASTYNFTVTETASGCTSAASVNVVINTVPIAATPVVGTITQPTCTIPTGSVALSALPSGAWTINPGGIVGTGTTTILTGLTASTTYNFTVTSTTTGCISSASSNVIFIAVPSAPAAPVASVTTQPTCSAAGTISVTFPVNGAGVSYTIAGTSPVVAPKSNSTGIFSGLASGNYIVTTTVDGCISEATTLIVNTVPGAPVAPAVGTITQPTCTIPTGSVALSGLPSGTWVINPGAIAGIGTTTTLTNLAVATTHNFTVTEIATGCISAASTNVIINPIPLQLPPTIGTIVQPICSEPTGSVVLSGLPSSGTWTLTRTPGGVTSSGAGSSATISGLSTGTYAYTVVNSAECISSASASVVINPQPVTPTAPIVGTVTQPTCGVATGSVVLSNLPSSGTWILTRTPGGITTAGTGISSTISGLSVGVYTYTVTNSAGCISPASTNVVINAQPAASTPPTVSNITQPTCSVATGSVTLDGLPPSGNWTLTRTPGGVTTNGTGTSITISGLLTGIYSYTVTNSAGCISSASSNVVINAQPSTPAAPIVATITQPTCIVETGSIVLSGLPSSGTWTLTRTPGGVTSTGTGTSVTISGLSTGTYTYTVTSISGCISPASGDIDINPQPVTPVAPSVGTLTQPTCNVATGSVILNNLPSSGTWTLTRTPGGVTTTGTGTSRTISGLLAGTYTYTVTNASGCVSALSDNVDINAQPVTPTAPSIGNLTQPSCSVATGSVVLNNLPSSGTWTLTRTPGGVTTTGTGTSATIAGLVTGTYTYTVTNASTCVSVASSNITINVQPVTPTAPSIGILTQPTCSVASGSVVISSLPSTGTWTLTRVPGGVTSVGTGTSVTISGLSTGNYTYTVTNSAGCISSASSNVVINSQPAIPTAPTVATVAQPTCTVATGSVVLNNLPSSGTWTLTRTPGGVTSTGTGTSVMISGLSTGTYTYTVTSTSGCISPASGSIDINPQPLTPVAPSIGTLTQPTCSVATGSVILNNLPSSGTWTLTRTPGGVTTTGTGTSRTISGLLDGTYTYTVINASGCVSSLSDDIDIDAQPVTPTAPSIGTLTQPSCSVATGGVVLNNLPSSGTWTLTRTPGGVTTTGTGTSATIAGLVTGTYTYTVTNSSGCISPSSGNVVINIQPATPAITNQTTSILTGGNFNVTPTGVPVGTTYTWTTPTYTGGVTGGSAQVTAQSTISGSLTIPAGTGVATYIVTPRSGACVGSSFTVRVTVTSTCVPVTIGTQPVNTSMCSTAGNASFSVVATGTSPFTFQWQYNDNGSWINVANGTPAGASYTNATTATLNITGISTPGSLQYRCSLTNCSGAINTTSAVVTLTVNTSSISPSVGIITQPTCSVATGGVVLNNLPSSGTWTLTRTPGGVTTTGSGTNTTMSGLATGTYAYSVTNASGCVSPLSANVVINAQPVTPTPPTVGTITQPTCSVSTGSVVLNGLPSSGAWTITSTPGGVTTSGTGTSTLISGLTAGTYSYKVTDASTCISAASTSVVISAQPATPTPPIIGAITQPTCAVATGSVVLSGLPSSGTWTLTRSPGGVTTIGTGTSRTISGLSAGIYTYKVTNASACASLTSANVVINAQPATPTAPIVLTIAQPSCLVATGSVVLSGLPSSGMWILTRTPGGVATTGTGTSTTISGLSAGTYTYRVTNVSACVSIASASVVINAQPVTPTALTIGTISQPTCAVATGSVVLNNLPLSGEWTLTRSPGGITSTGTGTSTTISGLTNGTYTYTVTNASGCVSPISANVVINASVSTPTSPIVGTVTQPTCTVATGSVVLSGLPSSGTWTLTRSPGGSTTTGMGASTTLSGLVSGAYTYAVTNASGCVSPVSTNVVIKIQPSTPAAPTATVTAQPTCSVTSGTITVTVPAPGGSGVSFTVIGTSPFVAAQSNETGIFSGLAAGNYNVTTTSNGCTSSATALSVNNKPVIPTLPTVSDIAYCQNATSAFLTATALTDHTLQWYDMNATGGTASATAPKPSTSTKGTSIYYVSQKNNFNDCEGERASISVSVNSLPDPPIVSSITYCNNAIATELSAISSSGHILLWYGTNATGGSSSTVAPIPSTTIAGTTNYYVSQLNISTGCEGDRISMSVIVNTIPAPPVVSSLVYCEDAAATALTATALSDHTLQWYGIDATGGISSAIAPTPSTSLVGTTDYYVSQINTTCGGESERAKISVTVNASPISPIVSDINHCKGAVVAPLTSTALSGHTLLWYGTDSTGGTSSTSAPIPSTSTTGTTSYYVSQRNTATSCESERVGITVTINSTPKPIITATGVGTENVVLSSSASDGNQWVKDGLVLTGASSQIFSVLDNGVYQVSATVDDCISELSDPFTVLVTAIEDIVNPISLKLFPVPAQMTINIQLTGVGNDDISEIMIFDMSGRMVDKQKMRGKESTLIVEDYPAGEYFLRISNKSFLMNSRILKY